jgi:hypothetical protein
MFAGALRNSKTTGPKFPNLFIAFFAGYFGIKSIAVSRLAFADKSFG